jgi:hypothetical protein
MQSSWRGQRQVTEEAENMDALQRVLEHAMALGLSHAIAYVALIPVVALVGWGIVRFAKWYIRRRAINAARRMAASIVALPKIGVEVGASFARDVLHKADGVKNRAIGMAPPAVRVLGNEGLHLAKKGAESASAFAERAAPIVREQAGRAVEIAKGGAMAAIDQTQKSMPAVKAGVAHAAEVAAVGAASAFGALRGQVNRHFDRGDESAGGDDNGVNNRKK